MAASPPAPPSIGSSQSSFHEPNLEQLVEYLLASKRSLSSISHVWRAREIVESGRAALEENATLCAKNTFVRHALDKQIESLEAIRYGVNVADAEGFDEFTVLDFPCFCAYKLDDGIWDTNYMLLQATVQSLDAAQARLNRTLESLRTALVEPTFRPSDDPPKHLIDFVDEAGIGELEESIKLSIDRFEAARSTLAETCEAFDGDLDRLQVSLLPAKIKEGEEIHTEDGETPVPSLFYQLETKATETASHLEALAKHYDLCITAMKHTEGGGEAFHQASADEEQESSALVGLGVDLGKIDDAPAKSISEEERLELLSVLIKDAGEVEEVVSEIKDSLSEMEDSLIHISSYVHGLRNTSAQLRETVAFLQEVAGNIPNYIIACVEFTRAWEDEKNQLVEKLESLEGLTDFYSGFEGAYDGLILEVQRRKQIRKDMEKVIKAAMADLEALYQGL